MLRGIGFFCILILFSGFSGLHRQHKVFSEISYNHQTKMLEIIHIIHGHDLQDAVDSILDSTEEKKIDIYDDTQLSKKAIKKYFDTMFILDKVQKKGTKFKNTLKFVGYENEGNTFYIYYEKRYLKMPHKLIIMDNLLQNIYMDQINQVKLKNEGKQTIVIFSTPYEKKEVFF